MPTIFIGGARGELAVALPLGVTGLGLLGWAPAGWWPGFWRHDQKSPGQASQVRSDFLIVELDHDTGAMTGEIIAGRLAGTKLDQLEQARWFRFSASSTRKAGTYWQRILTAGIPDGVKTRRAMRQRGAAQRDPAK